MVTVSELIQFRQAAVAGGNGKQYSAFRPQPTEAVPATEAAPADAAPATEAAPTGEAAPAWKRKTRQSKRVYNRKIQLYTPFLIAICIGNLHP